MKKLLGILLFSCLILIPANAGSDLYQKLSKEHKAWAKDFYKGTKDKERYENIIEKVLGKDINFKPKKIPFPGIVFKLSQNSKIKNGGMAEIKNAPEFSYNGSVFYSVAVDQSKCKVKEGWSDCSHHKGSSRVEFRDKSKWTFTEGTEKWINYALLPAHNILFNNRSRNFHIGQCHPQGHTITWMVTINNGKLHLQHNFKSNKINDGTWVQGSEYPSFKVLKKWDNFNEYNGSLDWTDIRINFKNSKNPDGKLKVWLENKLVYDYEGPTNWNNYKGFKGKRDKCYFKFGLYTNANLISPYKEDRENMIVFVDNMAIAKTESELENLLKKDK